MIDHLERAEAAIAEGHLAWAASGWNKAMDLYKKAWDEAQQAMNFAEK